MKKLSAIILTLAMLFTSYAFAIPASAEYVPNESYILVDGVAYTASMSGGSSWNGSTNTWTPSAGWQNITFTANAPLSNVTEVKFTLSSGITTGQNLYVVYSDGTTGGGWTAIKTAEQTVTFSVESGKTVSGFKLHAGQNPADLTVHDISLTYSVESGKQMVTTEWE